MHKRTLTYIINRLFLGLLSYLLIHERVSGSAMVLDNRPEPGRHTYLDNRITSASLLALGAGGGCLDIFSHLSFLFFYLPPSWRRPDKD